MIEKKVDGSIGKKIIDWEPEFTLKAGVEETVNWYISNYENKFIEEIKEDGIHYCTVVMPSLSKEGLNFITADEQSIQVGIWNYTKEKIRTPLS